MAQDDMFVIMYRIIAYLYDCTKKGKEPSDYEWNADALGIPESYWRHIVSQLVGHGMLEGITVAETTGGTVIAPYSPRVTMEGVQFAQENSMMSKAAKFLKEAKASIPFI